jgi:hypothetical protein
MADLRRDFWIRETGTGQQVAQLHVRYVMILYSFKSMNIWKILHEKLTADLVSTRISCDGQTKDVMTWL